MGADEHRDRIPVEIDGVDAITPWVARELASIGVEVPDYVDVIDPTENHVIS